MNDPQATQGTLAEIGGDNPLVASAAGQPANQTTSSLTSSDTAASPYSGANVLGPGGSRPPVSGGASMGDMLMGKGQRLPEVSSPHVAKIGDNVAKSLKDNPEAAAKPGGWARALVGGAADALRGISAFGDVLGDAATGTAPAGGGALEGISRTMQNRGQRMHQAAEQQDKMKTNEALRAETQARTIALVRNTHQQEQEDRLKSYGRTASRIGELKTAGHVTTDKLTQAQFDDLLKNNPDYLKTHTGGVVGEEPLLSGNGTQMKDENGTLVYSPLYQLAEIQGPGGQEGKKKLTAADSKYFKDYLGVSLPENTELTTDQYLNQHVKAQSVEDAENSIIKANDNRISQENLRQVRQDLSDPSIQRYAAMTPGNPLDGLNQASKNVEAHMAVIDKQIGAAQKSGNGEMVQQLQQKRKQFADEDEKINHLITFGFDDKVKEKYQTRLDEDRKQTEVERHNKAEEQNKAREVAAKEAQNDPDALAPLVVDEGGNLDPSQLSKRASTYAAQLGAIDAYARKKYGDKPSPDGYYDGTHFNIAKAQTDYKFANRGDTQNTLKYLNSLTGGTDPTKGNLSELVNKSNQITRTEFPALNDVAAWARLQTGDNKIVGYRTTVTEVADQVAKILQGGGSGNGTSDAKLKQAQELFDKGFTKDQITEVANSLRPLLSNRRDSMIGDNRYLIRQFGKSNVAASAAKALTPPQGATVTYRDPKTNEVKGWAVSGKFVAAGAQ